MTDKNPDYIFVAYVRRRDGTIIRPRNGKALKIPVRRKRKK
jgi:hypothetical protein